MTEEKQPAEQKGPKYNFAKLSPEEQKRISREKAPPDADEPEVNEKLGRENAKKFDAENSKHIV